jgi:hypothetical protein
MHPAAIAIWLDAGTAAERAAVTQALLYSLLPAVNKTQGAALSAWSALHSVRQGKQELTRQFAAGFRQGGATWRRKADQLTQQLTDTQLILNGRQQENQQLDMQNQALQADNQRLRSQLQSQQKEISQLNTLCQQDALADQVIAALSLMKRKRKHQLLQYSELAELPLLLTLVRQHADLLQICRDSKTG